MYDRTSRNFCVEEKLLASVSDLSSNFVSEVFFLLLDAFALHIVNSVNKLDGTPGYFF